MEKKTALEQLTTAAEASRAAAVRLEKAVHAARGAGASWGELAAPLTMTRQAVQQKYGKGPSKQLIAADHAEDAAVLQRSQWMATPNLDTTPETPSMILDAEVPAPTELEPATPVDDQDDRAAFWEAKRRYAVTDCGAIYAPEGEHGWKLHDVVRNTAGKFHKERHAGMAELLHEYEGVLWINNDRYEGLVRNTAHSRETWIVVAADKANKSIVSVSAHRELSKEVDAMQENFERINETLKAKRTRKKA